MLFLSISAQKFSNEYNNTDSRILQGNKQFSCLFLWVPQLGQQGKLYVDTDDREISVWNEDTGEYITVSNYTEEVTEEDIEDLFD